MNTGKSPVAIVLGGTNPHIELINQLKKRGYFVILADYLENPPARSVADLHDRASTLDQDAILKLAQDHNAQLVISACVDQANITACYVAEKLGLTRPYSYKTAQAITNKGIMKQVMSEYHIPTTKYAYLENGEKLPSFNLRYPVMVKPADSCAASGVKKASNAEELAQFLQEAKTVSRTGRTVVEEFFAGTEVSAYCFVQDDVSNIIMVSERLSIIEGEKLVLKCYATVTPPAISDTAMAKLGKAATDIANAFKLDNTPLHVQAIINGDDISIIEFAPRVGGGISYRTIRENTGFDIISATIDSYLQKRVALSYHDITCYQCVDIIYGKPGVFDHIIGVDELVKDGVIEGFHYHKTKGMTLSNDRASAGRIGAFIVKGDTRKEVGEKVNLAMKRLEAFAENGSPMLRKDLYFKP
ncbi:MAG: ATP-grasp domain-containing protein [Victivallales bacterium]|nr:ATP-grasp domain-containing protein [Victivallales bacterium]